MACNDCHKAHVKKDPVMDHRLQAEKCLSCHKKQQAKLNLPSYHPIKEGKTACSDCHNPHGTGTIADLDNVTLNELCLSCHTEKRGPFLFEHAPVAEDCSECHEAHGSAHPSLLISRPPFLCQRCHMSAFHPSTLTDGSGLARGTPNSRLLGESCLNCHGSIHGSNHPSGDRLTR
jgi:DmsE family decaheme c-type cytochrome